MIFDKFKAVLQTIGNFFRKIYSSEIVQALQKSVEVCLPYVPKALEICAEISRSETVLGKTADAVVNAADKLHVLELITEGDEVKDVGTAFRDVAVAALAKAFPGVPRSILIRAVEMAVGVVNS